MTLPVDRDLQGRPTGATELLTLVWQGQLQFDGLTARFERGVEAKLTNQYLRTDRLNRTLWPWKCAGDGASTIMLALTPAVPAWRCAHMPAPQ